MITSNPIRKIPKTRMRKAAKMAAPTTAKTVNSVFHRNTNHHPPMTMQFLIHLGLLEGTHTYFGVQSLCKKRKNSLSVFYYAF